MERALPGAAGDPALPRARRRPLRALRRDIQLDTRVVEAAFDEASGPLGRSRPTRASGSPRAYVHHGHRLPVGAAGPGHPGPRRASRASGTTPARWPHEGVDFTGKRVGVIGTGSSGIQLIPDDRARRPRTPHVFQRTANFSVPDANRPLDPEASASGRRATPSSARPQRRSTLGVAIPPGERAANETPDDEVRQILQKRWEQGGGMPVLLLLHRPPRRRGGQRDGRRLRAREDPRDGPGPATVAELLVPRGLPHRREAPVSDDGLLRDVQPRQRHARRRALRADRGDHAHRRAHDRGASTSSTRSSSPPASTR